MIHERRGQTRSGPYVEAWRDDCPTVLILTPQSVAELVGVVSENSRWRLMKQAAIAKRKKRSTDVVEC